MQGMETGGRGDAANEVMTIAGRSMVVDHHGVGKSFPSKLRMLRGG